MAFWEFLIQKEGDRSWLPLDSTVEILEGRYRIVARSSRLNTSVEIRVIHSAIAETPPVRRIQKRVSQTNADGLVVIIPYTRLLPGSWELRCASDLMADMMGNGWLHSVRLEVQPIEVDHHDWEADWQETEDQLHENRPTDTDQPGSEAISLDRPVAVGAGEAIAQNPSSVAAAVDDPELRPLEFGKLSESSIHSLCFQLDKENYVVQRGQPLILNGSVVSGSNDSAEQAQPTTVTGKLRVRLFDPQTAEMLVDETQPLLHQLPPFPVALAVALPANCETHVILGELALYGQSGEGSLPPVLATQRFSVTTDLLELLDAIANDFTEPVTPPTPPTPPTPADNSAFLNLRPSIVPAIQFRPAIQQPLPPQLRPADSNKAARPLDLPAFSKAELEGRQPTEPSTGNTENIPDAAASTDSTSTNPAPPDPAPPDPASIEELPATDPASPAEATPVTQAEVNVVAPTAPAAPSAELPSPELPSEIADLPPALRPQLELVNDTADPANDWQSAGDYLPYWQQKPDPDAPSSNKAEDVAFRSLNLQERFWSKLQSLVGDTELAGWLNDEGESATAKHQSTSLDAELAAHEIVVEDPPKDAPEDKSNGKTAATVSRLQTLATLTTEPIAVPELEVPMGELTCGQTIPITIRLSGDHARVYAKLWMHDRQSRTLLDGPHWLMDFTPDGFGNLVVKSQVMVPFGCVEVQFEAIAIDMTTQRESAKVSIVRTTIPPSLTTLSIEELEG